MNKLLLIMFVLAAGLASCSKEDLSPDKPVTGTPLTISYASIDAITRSTGTAEVTAEGAQIGVYQIANISSNYGGTLKGYQYNSVSTPKWHALSEDIYLNANPCDVIGVYPYTAIGNGAAIDPTNVSLTSQWSDATSTQDLCYQKVSGLKNSSYSVTFDQMQHAYAKLTFRISKDETSSYPGSGILNSITVSNAGIIKTCSFNLTTATLGPGIAGDVSAGIPNSLNVTIPASTATPAYVDESFLMIPVSVITGSINLTLDIDGTIMKGAIASIGTPLTTFTSGNEYIVTVGIEKTGLTIENIKVVDWITDATWNGSETPLVPATN